MSIKNLLKECKFFYFSRKKTKKIYSEFLQLVAVSVCRTSKIISEVANWVKTDNCKLPWPAVLGCSYLLEV